MFLSISFHETDETKLSKNKKEFPPPHSEKAISIKVVFWKFQIQSAHP